MRKYLWVLIPLLIIVGAVAWAKTGKPPAPPAVTEYAQEENISVKEEKSEPIKSKTIIKNGMTIEVIKEGSGAEIQSGQTAVVDYVGKLTDGSVFDASAKHGKAFSFPLGAGMVIKGWDQGVVGMKVGETRMLTIPPELGYGANGYPPIIPQNATLIFEVTLREIK